MANSLNEEIGPDGTILQPSAQETLKELQQPKEESAPEGEIAKLEVDETHVDKEKAPSDNKDEKPLISTDDYLSAKDIDHLPSKVKEDEKSSKTDKDKEKKDVPEQEVKKEVEVSAQPKTTTKVDPKDGRDYSDIPEEDKAVWRSMSNDSFNKLKPIYLEHQKQKIELEAKANNVQQLTKDLDDARKGIVKMPENYFEHPNAFVLTPEFERISHKSNLASQVFNHWRNQLKEVKGGAKDWISIKINDQGQLVADQRHEANDDTQTMLEDIIEGSKNQFYETQTELRSLAAQHKQKATEFGRDIETFERESFPVFETNPETKKNVEEAIKQIIPNLPAPLQKSAAARTIAKFIVLTNNLGALLKQAADEKAKGIVPSTDKTAANGKPIPAKVKSGPSAAEIAGGLEGGKGKSLPTLDDFRRMKEGDY